MDILDFRFEKCNTDRYFSVFETKDLIFFNRITVNSQNLNSEILALNKSCGKMKKIETSKPIFKFAPSCNHDKIYYLSIGTALDCEVQCNVIDIENGFKEKTLFSNKKTNVYDFSIKIATQRFLVITWKYTRIASDIIQFYDLKSGKSYEIDERNIAEEGILEIQSFQSGNQTWYLFKTGSSIMSWEKEKEVINPIYNINYHESIMIFSEESLEKYLDVKQSLHSDIIHSIDKEGCIKSLWITNSTIVYDVVNFDLNNTEVNCVDIESGNICKYKIRKDFYRIAPGNGYLCFLELEPGLLSIYDIKSNCLLQTIHSKSMGHLDFLGIIGSNIIIQNTRKDNGKLKNFVQVFDTSSNTSFEHEAQAYVNENDGRLYLY